MKTSTAKAPKPADPLAIALMGDYGTTKTSLSLRFPSPGVLDLDGNLDGPAAWVRKQVPGHVFHYVQPLLGANGATVIDKDVRDRISDGLRELPSSKDIRTIIVSSGTKLSEVLVMGVLARHNAELMEMAFWKPWRAQMLRLIHDGRSAGKHFIWEIHEQPVYGPRPVGRNGQPSMEPPPRVGVEMSMPTRLSEVLGFTFTDVWRAVKLGQGASLRYELRFVSDGEANLKNSLGLTTPISMDWGRLEPLLKGRL